MNQITKKVNYGTIEMWYTERVPVPYQSAFDVPGEWVPIEVTDKEAERLLTGDCSWMYRKSMGN